MTASTSTLYLFRDVKESLFPLEYYAKVQGSLESILESANTYYDVNTIEKIFAILQHFINLNYGRLYVCNAENTQLVAKYGRTLELAALKRGNYSLGEGVTGQAFLERQALYVTDLAHQPMYKGRSIRATDLPYKNPAYMAVPFYGEHWAGVVGFHLSTRSRFDVIATIAIVSLIAEWLANKHFEFELRAA